MKVLLLSVMILFTGCQLIEINIVQRAVIESGEDLSSESLDHNLREETSQMRLVVPLK